MKLIVYCKQCSSDNFKHDFRTNKFVCLNCGRNHDKNQLVITGRISEKTLWAIVDALAEVEKEEISNLPDEFEQLNLFEDIN